MSAVRLEPEKRWTLEPYRSLEEPFCLLLKNLLIHFIFEVVGLRVLRKLRLIRRLNHKRVFRELDAYGRIARVLEHQECDALSKGRPQELIACVGRSFVKFAVSLLSVLFDNSKLVHARIFVQCRRSVLVGDRRLTVKIGICRIRSEHIPVLPEASSKVVEAKRRILQLRHVEQPNAIVQALRQHRRIARIEFPSQRIFSARIALGRVRNRPNRDRHQVEKHERKT